MTMEPARNNVRGALQGLRILDLSMWWAGPRATRLLVEAGAEVIKVEAPKYPDPWRGATLFHAETKGMLDHLPPSQRVNVSPGFNLENHSKLGLTLDLSTADGREILLKLVKISDVLVENYAPRVMKNFNLEYPVIREANPDIIMISMPAFGLDGEERDYVAFGATLECMMGVSYITGYEGEGPMALSQTAYTDPIGGINAALAILMGLRHRRRTGRGTHIEMAQLEGGLPFMVPAIMDYTMNGRVWGRSGNRHPWKAPHGNYPCLGEDAWVSISVGSDAEWLGFCRIMDRPDLAEDPRFVSGKPRWEHRVELDPIIEAWTRQYDPYTVMDRLQSVGIAAGPVLNAAQIVKNPHLLARDFFREVAHPVVGAHSYSLAHPQMSETPVDIRRSAPLFAEHNDYILKTLLGMTDEEIARLKEQYVICDEYRFD